MNPICLLLALWRTIRLSIRCRSIVVTTGHDYRLIEDTPPNVCALKCVRCGHRTVEWSWSPLPCHRERGQ